MISLESLRAKKMEHPKIEAAAAVIWDEFSQNKNSKVLVFSQFRESALRIAERANQLAGVRAATFFGQAKKGETGLSQKEQKAIVDKFRSGEVNVLCATSIGEEGLDIPEVSAVLFYEPIPSAIRKIQRAGRTARLAPGKLFILVTEDTRDVVHHYASKARERKMYKTIELVQKELRDGKKNPTLDSFGDTKVVKG
jgi:ERCC4-related helicase